VRRLASAIGLFAAGTIFGTVLMQPGRAQSDRIAGIRLNHVGVWAKNLNESLAFYTKVMGFREGFVMKDPQGNPTTYYLQVNKDTFLELAKAPADRQPGLSHVGIWVDDIKSVVSTLRERGQKIDDPRVLGSKAPLTNITDPDGNRIELLEFTPDSLQRKAIDAWK
jgi:catechol 2,3-dioxygenase-like lactoylglutathione lyase family enzyme